MNCVWCNNRFFAILLKTRCNKTIIDLVLVISIIIKVSVSVISLPSVRLITPTSTLMIPDITKTSSKNCLLLICIIFTCRKSTCHQLLRLYRFIVHTSLITREFKRTFRSPNSSSFVRKTMNFGSLADGMVAFTLIIILFPISQKINLKTSFGTSSK